MKRLFVLGAMALSMVFISSCNKIESALFKPFESPLSFDITIPIISNTTSEIGMGQTNVQYNLDSVIRKNTANAFGADIVGAMYINEIGIQLIDDDASNNLSNFDYVKLNVSTSSTPVVLGPFNIPAGTSSSLSFAVEKSPNIKPFFSSTAVTFSLIGKANTKTTKSLRAHISATIKFEK